jgi:hypothetical protein
MKKKADPLESRTTPKQAKQALVAPVFKPPLKPRRGLFFALLGALALWIIGLLVLYFVTVYPTRKEHEVPPPGVPSERTIPR